MCVTSDYVCEKGREGRGGLNVRTCTQYVIEQKIRW